MTVSERYRQNRLIPNAIEPRAVFVTGIPATGEYTLWSTTQVPHIARLLLSGVVGIPEAKLRVIAPDVGGGFGSKLNVYAEEALALAIARRLGRAVKWTETRSEGYLSTIHGRDQIQEIELAATSEGKILAVRTKLTAAMGAYLQLVTPGVPLLGAWLYGGCYDLQGYSFECTGVFTNTVPTDAYRGAGRPEATYAIERAVDALARAVGKDPVEIRRLNFIREFPAPIKAGLDIDSGDYDASLDVALEESGYESLRAEQQARRDAGDPKRLGIGLSTYVEMCGLAPSRILGAIRYCERRLGGGDDPLPADGNRAGADRLDAARAGARDVVVADRRRPARLRDRRGRGAARRHLGRSARDGHVRQPQPRGRRRRALLRGGEDRREGEEDRRARAGRRRSAGRARARRLPAAPTARSR